jgi:hypothetical protein
MGVQIDAVKARAEALLNVAQREKDKREQAKKQPNKEAAGDEATGHEGSEQPVKPVGRLIDRSA